jgi:hypothetical protein
MTENQNKTNIIKMLSVGALILLVGISAYTYPKSEPTIVQAEEPQPTLEQLKTENDLRLEEARKKLEAEELEKQILELKEKQESLKVQR